MAFRPTAPNLQSVVNQARDRYPEEWKLCHKNYPQPEGSEARRQAERFINIVARLCHDRDARFGVNYSRGNRRRQSQDALAFKNPASPAGGVEIIDVVAAAGSSRQSTAWSDETQKTADAGTIGLWGMPPELPGGVDPPPPPPPTDLEARVASLESWARRLSFKE